MNSTKNRNANVTPEYATEMWKFAKQYSGASTSQSAFEECFKNRSKMKLGADVDAVNALWNLALQMSA
jgi:hypothetical protein